MTKPCAACGVDFTPAANASLYCSPTCRPDYVLPKNMRTMVCATCGVEFKYQRETRKHCSTKCANIANHPTPIGPGPAICVVCGDEFHAQVKATAKYCTKKCKNLAHADAQTNCRLLSMYGITLAQKDAMLEEQGGVCKMCKNVNPNGRELAVDHDHKCCPGKRSCGKCIRGLLCGTCNTGIGGLKDDPWLIGIGKLYVETGGKI